MNEREIREDEALLIATRLLQISVTADPFKEFENFQVDRKTALALVAWIQVVRLPEIRAGFTPDD